MCDPYYPFYVGELIAQACYHKFLQEPNKCHLVYNMSSGIIRILVLAIYFEQI